MAALRKERRRQARVEGMRPSGGFKEGESVKEALGGGHAMCVLSTEKDYNRVA